MHIITLKLTHAFIPAGEKRNKQSKAYAYACINIHYSVYAHQKVSVNICSFFVFIKCFISVASVLVGSFRLVVWLLWSGNHDNDDNIDERMNEWMNNANCKASSGLLLAKTSLLFSHVHTLEKNDMLDLSPSFYLSLSFTHLFVVLFIRSFVYFSILFLRSHFFSFRSIFILRLLRQKKNCLNINYLGLVLFVLWINGILLSFTGFNTPDFRVLFYYK